MLPSEGVATRGASAAARFTTSIVDGSMTIIVCQDGAPDLRCSHQHEPTKAHTVSRLDRGQRRLLSLAVASQASISVASWGLGALGPELRETFQLSAAQLGLILAAGFIGNAVILIPAGTIVDRHGPRRPLIAGGLVSGLTLVGAGFSSSALLVGIALFCYGLTGAFVAVAGTVSIFHGFDAASRGTALGFRQMAVSLGGLVAAGLLPALAALGGVRLALVTSGIIAGTFATLFGLASPPGALHAGDRSRPRGLDIAGLMRIPGLWRVVAISAVHVSALTTLLNFSVPAIRDEGASVVVGAVLFGVVSVSAMIARLAWGRIADVAGGTRRRASLRDVGIVTVVGALLYFLVAPLGPAVQMPVAFIFAFGATGANGVLYLIAGELTGPARAGQAVGLTSMALFGVSGLVSPLLGFQADHWGFRSLWLDAAVFGLLSVILTLGLPADRRT